MQTGKPCNARLLLTRKKFPDHRPIHLLISAPIHTIILRL